MHGNKWKKWKEDDVLSFLGQLWGTVWNFVGPILINSVKQFVVDLLSAVINALRPQPAIV